jgi:hypothetical protein
MPISVFVPEIEFNGIEADDDKTGTTFFAGGRVVLFYFGVDENFFTALGTNGCWHRMTFVFHAKIA